MGGAEALAAKWMKVGDDLGIEVVAPYWLRSPRGNYEFACLLPEFGSSRGMVLMADFDREAAEAAASEGFGYSCLTPESVNVDYAIECLLDWGWSNEAHDPPNWYMERDHDGDAAV
jgi:hypothetical protein